MKLPAYYNLYNHNQQLDKLLEGATMAALPMGLLGDEESAHVICKDNLKQLKALYGIIAHLELVIDEILKTRELR